MYPAVQIKPAESLRIGQVVPSQWPALQIVPAAQADFRLTGAATIPQSPASRRGRRRLPPPPRPGPVFRSGEAGAPRPAQTAPAAARSGRCPTDAPNARKSRPAPARSRSQRRNSAWAKPSPPRQRQRSFRRQRRPRGGAACAGEVSAPPPQGQAAVRGPHRSPPGARTGLKPATRVVRRSCPTNADLPTPAAPRIRTWLCCMASSRSRISSLSRPAKGKQEALRAGASPGPVWCSDFGVAMTHYRYEPYRLLGRSHQPREGGAVSPERLRGRANSIATLIYRVLAQRRIVNPNAERKRQPFWQGFPATRVGGTFANRPADANRGRDQTPCPG